MAAKTDPTPEELAAKVADLEAQNEALRAAADKSDQPAGEPRLVWVVTYPKISVQPKDEDGQPKGEPVILKQGEFLPDECVGQADQLRAFGYVAAMNIPQ